MFDMRSLTIGTGIWYRRPAPQRDTAAHHPRGIQPGYSTPLESCHDSESTAGALLHDAAHLL